MTSKTICDICGRDYSIYGSNGVCDECGAEIEKSLMDAKEGRVTEFKTAKDLIKFLEG